MGCCVEGGAETCTAKYIGCLTSCEICNSGLINYVLCVYANTHHHPSQVQDQHSEQAYLGRHPAKC